MHKLIEYYRNGDILYPRVENTYIQDNLYSYHPHSKLKELNSFFTPLKEDTYKLNSITMLLHLHNKRYLKPSHIQSFKKHAKERLYQNKKKIHNELDFYKQWIEKNNKKDLDYFIHNELNHYKNEKPVMINIELIKKEDAFLEKIKDLSRTIKNENNEINGIEHEFLL